MSYSYEDWNRHGKTWKKVLDKIEPLIQKLAKDWNAKPTREGSDAPQFELRWCADDGIWRSIQTIVEQVHGSCYLRIAISAWKDFEEQRERIWMTKDIEQIPISIHVEEPEIPSSYNQVLKEEAYPLVTKWKEPNLENRTPLPSRNANLMEDMVEQDKDKKLAKSAREMAAVIKEMVNLVD